MLNELICQSTLTMRNKKTAIFLEGLRRTWPAWIAALVVGWLLREVPAMAWNSGKGILPRARAVWAEGSHRISPSKTSLLKGTVPAIDWINSHVPRDKPLLYVGRMSIGIRLRYYTFPRAGLWHYIYTMKDATRALEVLETYAPAYVAMERLTGSRNFEIPENWRPVWSDPAHQLLIYEVGNDPGE
jgi:hypothetical protein